MSQSRGPRMVCVVFATEYDDNIITISIIHAWTYPKTSTLVHLLTF